MNYYSTMIATKYENTVPLQQHSLEAVAKKWIYQYRDRMDRVEERKAEKKQCGNKMEGVRKTNANITI